MSQAEPFEMDVVALKQGLGSNAPPAVLDVREPWEIAIAAMNGARATAWLRGQGFDKATNVAGGIDAWAVLADPSVARY